MQLLYEYCVIIAWSLRDYCVRSVLLLYYYLVIIVRLLCE